MFRLSVHNVRGLMNSVTLQNRMRSAQFDFGCQIRVHLTLRILRTGWSLGPSSTLHDLYGHRSLIRSDASLLDWSIRRTLRSENAMRKTTKNGEKANEITENCARYRVRGHKKGIFYICSCFFCCCITHDYPVCIVPTISTE